MGCFKNWLLASEYHVSKPNTGPGGTMLWTRTGGPFQRQWVPCTRAPGSVSGTQAGFQPLSSGMQAHVLMNRSHTKGRGPIFFPPSPPALTYTHIQTHLSTQPSSRPDGVDSIYGLWTSQLFSLTQHQKPPDSVSAGLLIMVSSFWLGCAFAFSGYHLLVSGSAEGQDAVIHGPISWWC